MIYAVIDIGSNTVRLSVYKIHGDKVTNLFNEKEQASLKTYVKDGVLSEKGIQRLIETLKNFKSVVDNFEDIDELHPFATATIRDAANRQEILDRVKDELDLDKDKKILLYLGRLAEEKNIEELIRFYEKLKDSSIAFYIVGGGPYLNKLKAYSKSFSKEINFVGMVEPSEVNKYYQAADIFTTASTSETQGLTYYEALSNGTVAICRDDNSLEGVIKDGFNGYRYHNFEEFNSYMNLVLDDEDFHKQLIDNARSYALENFSVESFGSKCEDLYKKAVNEYGYESSFIHKRL